MATEAQLRSRSVYRFGQFELDCQAGTLTRKGSPVKLSGQPIQLLCLLLQQPGEVVTREQLRASLWPEGTFVEFEGSLNAAVKRLRLALDDDAANPIFIETIPRHGYRFIAPVIRPSLSAEHGSSGRWRWLAWAGVAVAVVLAAGTIAWMLARAPSRAPGVQVAQIRRLSDFGITTNKIVTNGAEIFLSGHRGFDRPFLAYPAAGGRSAPLTIPLPEPESIRDASPDRSSLLVTTGGGDLHPLWKVPLLGGVPQRLGNVMSNDAAWSNDGTRIAFADGHGLYVMAANGLQPRRLAAFDGVPSDLVWSPDNSHIALTVLPPDERNPAKLESLWLVDVNAARAMPILTAWNSPASHPAGWTRDGAFFIFSAMRQGISELWAQRVSPGWQTHPSPTRLTFGPVSFRFPVMAKHGETIIAIGEQRRAELLKYDLRRHQYAPFLGGRADDQVAFSPDGQWAAYISYPDGTLWRSRADGTQPVQLTFPPVRAFLPQWSPDSRQILFQAVLPTGRFKGFLVTAAGGMPRMLLPESGRSEYTFSWFLGGQSILYNRLSADASSAPAVDALDLPTGRVATLPGVTGDPFMSPNGQWLAISNERTKELSLLNLQSHRSLVVAPSADYAQWSRDSRDLYFNTLNDYPLTPASGFYRYSVARRHLDRVLSRPDFPLTGVWGTWVGRAPDGSPLLLKDDNIRAIYAIDLSLRG